MNVEGESTDTMPLKHLVEIDKICALFEESWTPEKTIGITQHLDSVPEKFHKDLLHELLLTDFERRDKHECLKPQQFYMDSFPEFHREILYAWKTAIDRGICPPDLQIGRYHIRAEIAKGGMGKIYRAHDSELQREVAIKTLLPKAAKDPNRLSRFKTEMTSVAALAHPNIVTLYDVVNKNGAAFAIMELLEGQDLSQRLRDGKLQWKQALGIVLKIADGMVAAHDKGIIHRDIKPANIFLTKDGKTKILDFGIARLRDTADVKLDDTRKNTQTGTVIGTVDYMSPEQLRGERVDVRSDIFSLGAVLFEMITGRKTFGRESIVDTKAAIIMEEPEFKPEDKAPAALTDLIKRCLEKETDKRYQTAADFSRDAQLVLQESMPVKNTRPSKTVLAGLLLIAATLIAGFIWDWNRTDGQIRFSQKEIRSLAVLPFNGDVEEVYVKEGLGFSLTNSLSRIGELNVRPFSVVHSLQLDGTVPPMDEVADDLMVDALVSGFVNRCEDGKVCIHVELINAKQNRIVWGADYLQPIDEVLDVQKKIVADITNKLQKIVDKNTFVKGGKLTTNLQAYEQFIHGQIALNQRRPESVKLAQDYFKKAVEFDKEFDMAYVGLANCFIVQSERNSIPPQVGYQLARQYAQAAIDINEMSIDAQISMAMIEFEHDWNFEAAESRFRRALKITIDSGTTISHPTGHQWFAEFLSAIGRYDEAIFQIGRAQKLDPTSAIMPTVEGLIHLKAGKFELAIHQLNSVLESHPNFDRARGYLIDAYELTDQFDRALIQWTALANSEQEIIEPLKNAYMENGAEGYWRQRLELSDGLAQIRAVSPVFLANVYCKNGQDEKAINLIADAVSRKDGALAPNLYVHPFFDSVRSNKRFQAILSKFGFPTQEPDQ